MRILAERAADAPRRACAAPARTALRAALAERLAHVALARGLLLLAFLAARCAHPAESVQDSDGAVGRPRELPRLLAHAGAAAVDREHAVGVALVTGITVPLAFAFAYALTRSRMPFKRLQRASR